MDDEEMDIEEKEERGLTIVERPRRVYWLKAQEGESDLLVFDGGYYGGDVHVYSFKHSRTSEDIKREVEIHFNKIYGSPEIPEYYQKEIVRIWMENKPGTLLYWDLGD